MTGPAPGVPVGVGRVGAARTASLVYGVTVRELLTRGRLIALAVLGVGLIAVGWAIGASESVTDPVEAAVELVANLGFTVVLPVVALVFGSASLGDAREDGTLVYLWLRPVDRLPIVVGAYLAAVTAVVPLTVTPIVVAAALSDGGGEVAAASALASVVGALAYTAVFQLAGLVIGRVIVWGLAYVLIWEGIAAALGTVAARLALRGYTRSILTDLTDVDLDLAGLSAAAGVGVLLGAVVVAVGLSALRLSRLDVT